MMTKVTERNMGAVMGKINKFLSRPTKIYEEGKEAYGKRCLRSDE